MSKVKARLDTGLYLFADLFISVNMQVEDSDPSVTRDQGKHRAGIRRPANIRHLDSGNVILLALQEIAYKNTTISPLLT